MNMTEYWNCEMATMMPERIKVLQLQLLNQQLQRARHAPAYRGKLLDKIHSLDEVKNLPFTCKDDLRVNYPYGFLAIPREQITRLNASSGTTGIPTLAYFSDQDVHCINERIKKTLMALRMNKGVFQTMLSLGLSVGGYSYYHAIQSLGMTLLPTGVGNTLRQIQMLHSLKPSFVLATPGFLLHVCHYLKDTEIVVKKAIVIGEPLANSAQSMLINQYGIDTYRGYGLTECGGGVAWECVAHKGLHLFEDQFYCEIVDPDTGEAVPDGEYGELVITPLQQEAMPLIRYRTRDITRFISGECPCGQMHRRIEPITHRIDDMMIINGVNVYPSQIEECIYQSLPAATNWQIHVQEQDGLKKIRLDLELPDEWLHNPAYLDLLKHQMMSNLKASIAVSPVLNFIPRGTLPEIQGKAKRVNR